LYEFVRGKLPFDGPTNLILKRASKNLIRLWALLLSSGKWCRPNSQHVNRWNAT